ncbi:hypothetical protein C8R45DRAFT_262814 [Mycena sanguinolenta]|nr:hypothetical protein C8R45DRAFT_262814 [Mycena sanguinolenta]
MAPKFALSILHNFRRVLRRVSHAVKPRRSAPILFLDLPCEVRLEIYDAVANLPVDCVIPTLRCEDPVTRLPIPWFSLMLVCRTITNEMRHYVRGRSTYSFLIITTGFYTTMDWLALERIPCPPSAVHTLQANLMLHCFTTCWRADDDEPTPLMNELCQMVNTFIRKGPLVTRERALSRPIHLDTLIGVCFSFWARRLLMFLHMLSARHAYCHVFQPQNWAEVWIIN